MYTKVVVVGILIAALYYECTHLSPGGMVTPVYLALCLSVPERILYTFLIVALSYGAVRVLEHFFILYGRRLFAVTVAVTFLLDALLGLWSIFPIGIRAIGYLVPALTVRDIDRQGAVKTGVSLAVNMGLCALAMLWLGAL